MVDAWLETSADKYPWLTAQRYAWIGQPDVAFDYIDRSAEQAGGPMQISINSRSLFFRPSHDDPRWQMFLEKYGISAEQLADLNFRVKLPN